MHEMQMLQMEVLRLQAVQAQRYQAGVQANYLADLVRQQMSPGVQRSGFNTPVTAGFDLRSAALNAQNRRASQLATSGNDQVPMSAGLGSKFGGRTLSGAASRFDGGDVGLQNPPMTPGGTTIISGGTALGSLSSSNVSSNGINGAAQTTTPTSAQSKSDSAVSWRRNGRNNSVLSGNRPASISGSPTLRITPPPGERVTPPPTSGTGKARPMPLRFSPAASQPIPIVAIDSEGADTEDSLSSGSSAKSGGSFSSPTTPHSTSSNDLPLSPREEAAKKLYEGLGIGRPTPGPGTSPSTTPQALPAVLSHRMASQPMRQPRGPPSGADELGPKNFATRIRRKAIGGLGVLMAGRERREAIEVY
jgi:hypothetical protein